ncbi:hypothetical protein [Amedibacillus sp. YH-ame10]
MRTVEKKNSALKKTRYKALMGLVVVSLLISCLMLQDINNTVLAKDEDTVEVKKPPIDIVTINPGAKIYLGGQPSTYVSYNTLLSDKVSSSVVGDANSIKAEENNIWNSYYGVDNSVSLGLLQPSGVPSLEEIANWGSYLPLVDTSYWLSNTNDEFKITGGFNDDAHKPDSEKKEVSIPLRGFANKDNSLENKEIVISGKHENGAWFDKKKYNLGHFKNTNSSEIIFEEHTLPSGYYRDVLGPDKLLFGTTKLQNTLLEYGNKNTFDKAGLKTLHVFSTPDCKPEEEVFIEYTQKNTMPSLATAITYNKEDGTFDFNHPKDSVIKQGSMLALLYFEQDMYIGSEQNTPDGITLREGIYKTSILDSNKKSGIEKFTGTINNGVGMVDLRYPVNYGTVAGKYIPISNQKLITDEPVYVLYSIAETDIKVVDTPNQSFKLTVDSGFRYIEDNYVLAKTILPVERNSVRPKMTLDTSKIVFARASNSGMDIIANPTLGAMPSTTLENGSSSKLVVKDDSLAVVGIDNMNTPTAVGGQINYSGGDEITITPGTTQIKISVTTNGGTGTKVSAVSTNTSGVSKYGIVGNVNDGMSEITINLADLMDTSELTGKGAGKTITLYNERLNKPGFSDTISSTGKDITIKVANPQTIDFTEGTKNALSTTTYAYGTEFEVSAVVKEKGQVDLIDTTTPITFTVNTDYLEQVSTRWDPDTFTQTARFKVVKPQNSGTDDDLKIKINRAATGNNDAALEVISSKVKTEKRKIDLKIDSSVFVANKGKDRLSLTVGNTMPDITKKYKVYETGSTTEDTVAIADQSKDRIPYSISTIHWLGNYVGDALNGVSKDVIPVENGKVLQSANGNIWKANITKGTNTEKNTWFEDRYTVVSNSPTDAIIDVYDVTGNILTSSNDILYANNIAMSLSDYNEKVFNLNGNFKKQALVDETKLKITNNLSPYKQIALNLDDALIRVMYPESHAGEYKVKHTLNNNSELESNLVVVDNLVRDTTTGEELRANTHIHEKGNKWVGSFQSSWFGDGWDRLARIEYYDLKTGAESEIADQMKGYKFGNIEAWKELGETTLTIETLKGTKLSFKIIVRDHAIITDDINVSANDLQLTVEEATLLAGYIKDKTPSEIVSILTPADNLQEGNPGYEYSKYKVYPYATNIKTGNRVEISSIKGLPEIASGKTAVETGVYEVTYTTVSGEIVKTKITVYAQDPTAFIKIPKTINLKKSNDGQFEATQNAEVSLIPSSAGKDEILGKLNKNIEVKTTSDITIAGTSTENTLTQMKVDVYIGSVKYDVNNALALLNLENRQQTFALKIDKGKEYPKDRYTGSMVFKVKYVDKSTAGS